MLDNRFNFIFLVHTKVSGADAYFPEINSDIWALESASGLATDPETGLEYEFRVYAKVSSLCQPQPERTLEVPSPS